jgi:hypothetical protein
MLAASEKVSLLLSRRGAAVPQAVPARSSERRSRDPLQDALRRRAAGCPRATWSTSLRGQASASAPRSRLSSLPLRSLCDASSIPALAQRRNAPGRVALRGR